MNATPLVIIQHQVRRALELRFDDGAVFSLPYEYLRVYSPSAEVRGHGSGQEILQVGKRGIKIEKIEPVGQYAIKICFDDGHDTGIYSWDVLYQLGQEEESNWRRYLQRLKQAGASRD